MNPAIAVRDLVAANIRTWVPAAVGLLLAWLSRKYDFIVDEESSTTAVQALVTFFVILWYVIFSVLERVVSRHAGWLLGLAKPPVYAGPETKVIPGTDSLVIGNVPAGSVVVHPDGKVDKVPDETPNDPDPEARQDDLPQEPGSRF